LAEPLGAWVVIDSVRRVGNHQLRSASAPISILVGACPRTNLQRSGRVSVDWRYKRCPLCPQKEFGGSCSLRFIFRECRSSSARRGKKSSNSGIGTLSKGASGVESSVSVAIRIPASMVAQKEKRVELVVCLRQFRSLQDFKPLQLYHILPLPVGCESVGRKIRADSLEYKTLPFVKV
jgi:hypothetical protein